MPPSSLEDRVRDLCAQVGAAKSEAELEVLLPQLQAALRDHIAFLSRPWASRNYAACARRFVEEVDPEALTRLIAELTEHLHHS